MITANTISVRKTFHSVITIMGMNETLGQRIARFRNELKLSQGALAKACGWASQSRIGNYELDAREPTLGDIVAIARALHIEPYELLPAEFDRSEPGVSRDNAHAKATGLMAVVSLRSRRVLERILIAAEQGRLTEEDLALLGSIAERFEARPPAHERPPLPTAQQKQRDALRGNTDPTE